MTKYNRKYNAEEAEKRKEALRQKVEEIINNFENSPETIVEYLKFNSKFYQYSANNTILIYEQNKFANYCASYKAFQDMGYQVQKGQTGMKIFVPRITTVFYDPEADQWLKLSEGTKEQKALVKAGKLESKQYTSFGIGTVFDIGQTDCPPENYPKILDMGFKSETHNRLYQALVNYAESKNISVSEKFLPSITIRGFYSRGNDSITLSDKLNDSMKLSVMAHELSHAIMHSSEDAALLPKMQKEIEADSLSLMIRQHLGISDVEDVRQDHLKRAYTKYVKMLEEDSEYNEHPNLSKILDNVNKAYNSIIDDFDKSITNYLEQHQETIKKMTLDEYLGKQGLSSPVDDFMIDKLKLPHGQSKYDERRMHENARKSSHEYHDKRNAAIQEYNIKVASGEIVQPTNAERYIKAAKGHPDNTSTQAAIRVLKKRGYIQDNNGNWIENLEEDKQINIDFSQTIDDFLNGKINPYAQIFVCKTTKAMLACGAQDLDIIINQSTLRKIMSNDEIKYKHPHNLDKNIIKAIPNELNNPIMILQGSEPSSIVLISNLTDQDNKNIIISCKLNSAKSIYEVNEITSVYPKNNISNYIDAQLNEHNLIGCNKKRANRLLKSLGLQSSEVEASIDYTNIISNTNKNVNAKDSKALSVPQKAEIDTLSDSISKANQALSSEIAANLKTFVDMDIKIYGEVQKSTQDILNIQGYQYTDGEVVPLDFNKEKQLNSTQYQDNKNSLLNLLDESKELTIDALANESKLQWYSFASGINDTEKVKGLLQKIQREERQVVSIYNDNNSYQLVYLNNNLQLVPYDKNFYYDADAALKAALANDHISKLVPYEDMLQSSVTQDLTALAECNNNKYPYIKINWSDNPELAQKGYLPFDRAEKLFKSINDINQENGTLEKASTSLFLDSNNTYELEIKFGAETGGIIDHIKELIEEGNLNFDKAPQQLQEYLKKNGLLTEQESLTRQYTQLNLFDIAEIT